METVQEIRQLAETFKKKQEFEKALPLFRELWDREKNEPNGYDLVKCLRKADFLTEAREFHEILKDNFTTHRIKNEILWLDYSQRIKNSHNENILSDAEELLSKTNKYDKYTGSIYSKTVLTVVKYLISKGVNSLALEWLDKLDFFVLSNSPFVFRAQKFTSDQKKFFIQYADVLVKLDKHINFIESCLTCLNFDGIKHTQFKGKILETIYFGDYVSKTVLALFLKYFMEEIYYRKKNSFNQKYNPNKILLISDLSDFEFCPVSFAINETFNVPSNSTWEKDEWLDDKKLLFDRYNVFKSEHNFTETFKDSSIEINETLKTDFSEIFKSKMLTTNCRGENYTVSSNETNTIKGSPDYIFENENGSRFAVIEKFTKRPSENIETAFSSDLIKLYGYIFELNTLKLDFGYLIYWYWQYQDINNGNGPKKKKIRIKSYRIFKVEKSTENKNKLLASIERIRTFKETKILTVVGDKISYANKCLHCSVVSFCNHKTGKLNLVKLPYEINELTLGIEPSVKNK